MKRVVLNLILLIVVICCLGFDMVCLCALVGGCATVPRTRFEQDRQTCWGASKVQSKHTMTALGQLNDPVSEQKVFEACMAQRGWK